MKHIDLLSLFKSISWRIIATMTTMIISYYVTGQIAFALKIGSIEVFAKLIIYYFHERAWTSILKKLPGFTRPTRV